ncbi:MAG: hypothetical protein ACLSF8_00655 [Dialister invisus]|jgi:hypothetical protein|uniref:hypothetical protein n=1 Tax=Dialister invisus TaxID=218538 RepID=UPI00206B645E|nr:MAG TPA: hypothetical protein [Caudoviricetes sp.]
MSVIYVQDKSPWDQIGNLAGLWAANRLQKIQDTRNAKDYATKVFGGYQEEQSPGLLSQLTQPQTPQMGSGLFAQDGLEKAMPHFKINTAGTQPLQSSTPVMQDALEQAAPHYQLDTQQVRPQPQTRPSAPDRNQIKQSLRNKAGEAYVSFIKSGYGQQEAARMAKEMLENDTAEEWNKQLSAYQDSVLEPARQDILNQLVYTDGGEVSGYDPKKLKAMAPRIAAYNYRAQQLGLPQIDMNMLNNINQLDKLNMKYQTMPNGVLVGINNDTGAVQQMGNYAPPQDPRRFYVNTGGGLFDTRSGQIIPGTAREVQGPGTSGYNSQIVSQLSHLQQMYEKQHMYDDDFDPSKSPYYAQLQQVLGLQQPGQPGDVTGGQKQLVNDEQGLSNKIMEMRQKMSKEEVQQALRNEGLGFYASWVP